MKKLNRFSFLISLVLVISVLSCCIKFKAIPTVNYTAVYDGEKVVNDSLVLDTNAIEASFRIDINAEAEISKLTFSKDSIITNVTNANNLTTYSTDTAFVIDAGKNYYFTTTVGDKDQNEIYQKLTILTKSKINKYTVVLRSSSDTTNVCTYGSVGNKSYNATNAKINSAFIDFVYFSDTTALVLKDSISQLFAPLSDSCKALGPKYFVNTSAFVTKNATLMAYITMNAKEFDNISDNEVIKNVGVMSTHGITNLRKDKVFAFQTAKGKKGLAKVVSFYPGSKGSITLSVKVQK